MSLGWRVSWQDYHSWRTADLAQPRPEIHVRDFATRDEADTEARLRRAAGMTVCVSMVPVPRRMHRERLADPAMSTVPKDQRRRLSP